MTKLTILLITLLLSSNLYSKVYKDSKAKIEDRINDLISRMSFEEKLGQMQQSVFRFWDDDTLDDVRSVNVG